jgi:hypothetical protein
LLHLLIHSKISTGFNPNPSGNKVYGRARLTM